MGGNAFEDTEPLTQEEYEVILAKITSIIQPICLKIEPYIPLPEKEMHGDIDFLIILKPGFTLQHIQSLLEIPKDKFQKNNNETGNSVYMKKQVDFKLVKDEHQFELCKFYKSYSGIGAFLGLFLPSKFVKFSEQGLICCAYEQHIKLQYVVCDNVQQVLKFYGLDFQRYTEGFKTRTQIFEYLRNLRFLDEASLCNHTSKHQTKLMKAFQAYLLEQGPKKNQKYVYFEDPLAETLAYFKKSQDFELHWKLKLQQQSKKKYRSNKWNGMHIMNLFDVSSKAVNGYKKQFESSFPNKELFLQFVDQTPFEQIVQRFSQVCNLQPKVQKPN